jgi:hypothetical protein
MYDQTSFADDENSVGYAINVFQESINKPAVEYLVNYDYLRRIMENYGFGEITDEEAVSVGFKHGTGMFGELYNTMTDEIKQNPVSAKWYKDASKMSEEEKKISFLNRFMIFKKIKSVDTSKISHILEMEEEEAHKEMRKDIGLEKATIEGLEKAAKDALQNAPFIKIKKGITKKRRVVLDKYAPIESELGSEAVKFTETKE